MDLSNLLEYVRHNLIVSCQAEEGFPLNHPHHLAAMAATAVWGGAVAIRASIPENIRAIRQSVDVPIIGIYKKDYEGFEVRITPTMAEVKAVIVEGVDMIALDATHRPRPDGQSIDQLIKDIKAQFDVPIMADISTLAEGIAAAQSGADVVSTTLSGYTDDSPKQSGPDIELIRELIQAIDIPVIGEGRINTPDDVRAVLEAGAFSVVVGSMITRPHIITERFAAATRINQGHVIALDIGGTKIAGAIVNHQGDVLIQDKVVTPTQLGGPIIAERMITVVESLLESYRGPAPNAIGISSGGQINQDGEIVGGTDMIPGWIGFPLKETIHSHFGLPTTVVNDGHAAALAEARYGAGRGHHSVLCVVIGTGLGGGLVLNGRLQHGMHGLAGSIGQMKVSSNGELYVPLETYVSGPGLALLYNENALSRVNSGLEVAERVAEGDKVAQAAVEIMGKWLGIGLSHALHMYDVSCVVIGGSVAQIGTLLFEAVRESLTHYGHSTIAHTPILPARFGSNAGLIGAAVCAHQ